MNRQPLVSILLPVYNGERYIMECLQSLLNQSYTHFEIVVINDGSTDTTQSILDSVKDARIKIINNDPNEGLISSLNKGILQAQGTLIARMDADDIAIPNRLQVQVEAFQHDDDLAMCGSFFYVKTQNGNHLRTLAQTAGEIQANTLFNSAFAHPSVMFNRGILSPDVLYYNSAFQHAEDYELWSRIVYRFKTINISKPLIYYREHAQQVSEVHKNEQQSMVQAVQQAIFNSWKFDCRKEDFKFLQRSYKPNSIEDLQQAVIFFEKITNTIQHIPTIYHDDFNRYLCNHLLHHSTPFGIEGMTLLKSSIYGKYLTFNKRLKQLIKVNLSWRNRR